MPTSLAGNKASGFTLLELMLVLVLIALAAALLGPRLSGGGQVRLQADLREAAAWLTHARRDAVISGQTRQVTLSQPPSTDTPTPAARSPRQTGHWVSRYAQIAAVEPKPDTQKTQDGKAYVVSFFPGGGASGGEFSFSYETFTATLSIDTITGKISTALPD